MKSGEHRANYIDMHSHIMPGVDDGSKDEEMTAQMLEIAADEGIARIIVTPHNKADRPSVSVDGIYRRIDTLYDIADRTGVQMDFYPGSELMYDSTLPERLANGEACTMADSDYVLVEFNPLDEYRYITEGLREIQYEGFLPIMAHCERYMCILKDVSKARELVKSGIYLQCNSHSVKPRLFSNNPETKFIKVLLDEQLVSFISTDAHRPEGRGPFIADCAEYLYKHYDRRYVNALLRENALHIIRNEDIER